MCKVTPINPIISSYLKKRMEDFLDDEIGG